MFFLYVGFYLIPRRVTVPIFEYHFSWLTGYALILFTFLAFLKWRKSKKTEWFLLGGVLLSALLLLIFANLVIQLSPVLDQRLDNLEN
ncbi:hypothetical protein HY345_00785 [Candidatus Microgenomates bacterium]|nr:hypothetical protein [Candidatus Microgenomates bacterium]